MVLLSVFKVLGFDVPRCARLAITAEAFSEGDFELEILIKGISEIDFTLDARIFLLFKCWISGSNPESFEIM